MARILIGNIKGPQGAQGIQGPQGPVGPQGPQGPQPPLIANTLATEAGVAALDAVMGKYFEEKFQSVLYANQIVNNCVTDRADLPGSAAQLKVLMDLYTTLNGDLTDYVKIIDFSGSVEFKNVAYVVVNPTYSPPEGYKSLGVISCSPNQAGLAAACVAENDFRIVTLNNEPITITAYFHYRVLFIKALN